MITQEFILKWHGTIPQKAMEDAIRLVENERAKVLDEVDMHLREARYTYDYGMGIGDNIGSALLKEYANGYNKGVQDGRAEERARVVDENKNAWGKVLNQLHEWKNNAENEHEQKIAYAYFSAIGIINQHLAEIEVKE